MEFLTAKQAGEWEEICGIAQASQKPLRNEKYFPSAVAEKISTTAFDTLNEIKEIFITIQKAVDASPELRSKKQLTETFIAGINNVDDVMIEWHNFVAEEREKELVQLIQEEKLKESETRKFLENAFRDGEIKTTGTDIYKLMPPVSRFGGGGARAKKKQTVIDKLKGFFERFFGVCEASFEKAVEIDDSID